MERHKIVVRDWVYLTDVQLHFADRKPNHLPNGYYRLAWDHLQYFFLQGGCQFVVCYGYGNFVGLSWRFEGKEWHKWGSLAGGH